MSTWSKLATQKLSRQGSTKRLRIAVVGIGSVFGGDDAAGPCVAQSLLKISEQQNNTGLLVIDAGVAPENFTGVIRRFNPDIVLLIDAAQMDEVPGSVAWLDWRETSGMSAATHGLPPYMLAQYLTFELKCEVYLIGIQPAGNQFDSQMSDEVSNAVGEICQTLANLVIIPGNDPDSTVKPLAV